MLEGVEAVSGCRLRHLRLSVSVSGKDWSAPCEPGSVAAGQSDVGDERGDGPSFPGTRASGHARQRTTNDPRRIPIGSHVEFSIRQPIVLSLEMPDADVLLYPEFFPSLEADALFADLFTGIAWKQDTIRLYGKTIPQPRLTAWYGEEGKTYTYSGITMTPHPWTASLQQIKQRIEAVAEVSFNSVLLNLYRDGRDSVAWHSDDEPELGLNPVIASVSLGAVRRFQFKHKHDTDLRTGVELTHGSLLLMRGPTQHFWKHQIPKSTRPYGARINLTFRVVM